MEITLARKVTEVFTNKIIEENKTVFMNKNLDKRFLL